MRRKDFIASAVLNSVLVGVPAPPKDVLETMQRAVKLADDLASMVDGIFDDDEAPAEGRLPPQAAPIPTEGGPGSGGG